jgi:hypothetical protein
LIDPLLPKLLFPFLIINGGWINLKLRIYLEWALSGASKHTFVFAAADLKSFFGSEKAGVLGHHAAVKTPSTRLDGLNVRLYSSIELLHGFEPFHLLVRISSHLGKLCNC